jgi:hypothetical protein
LILFIAAAQSQAATVSWNGTKKDKITFGKSYKGGGKSKLELHTGVGQQKLGKGSVSNSTVTFNYHNAKNRMTCYISCKRTPTKRKVFSVFEGDKLISRVRVVVRSKPNPRGDIMRFKVNYLAEGYSWSGSGKFKVCEKCDQSLQLIGPQVTQVSAVPVPPTFALLSTVFGMFGFGRMTKRKKKSYKQTEFLSKKPPLFYTEKG